MNKTEAHALLDAAKAGAHVPEWKIKAALVATGDLCWPTEPQRVLRKAGTWEDKRGLVMARAHVWDGLAA